MRTTVDIDDEVLERVKLRAKHQHLTTGRLISDLVRRQLDQPPEIVMTNGVPVLRRRSEHGVLTEAQIQEMFDKLLYEESGL